MTRAEYEALEGKPSRERIRALWEALPPSQQERIWKRMNADRRAKMFCVMFDGKLIK